MVCNAFWSLSVPIPPPDPPPPVPSHTSMKKLRPDAPYGHLWTNIWPKKAKKVVKQMQRYQQKQ